MGGCCVWPQVRALVKQLLPTASEHEMRYFWAMIDTNQDGRITQVCLLVHALLLALHAAWVRAHCQHCVLLQGRGGRLGSPHNADC